MLDDWEDWETSEFNIPVLNIPLNKEQLKQLEERKLVEESDNDLSRELFETNKKIHTKDNNENNNNNNSPKKNILTKKISYKHENEFKLKQISEKIKDNKIKMQKAKELYGESNDLDDYADYEDKYF
jgi:hypothetical protein